MKKFLLLFSLFSILFVVACTSPANKQAVQPAIPAFDTTGLADFQEWKFINERKEASDYLQEDQPIASAPVKAVRKKAPARKPVTAPKTKAPAPVEQESDVVNDTPVPDESGTVGSEGTNTAKKKGISNTVKGTVIGAVSGAVLGAVINKKNRVVGGVVGGVIGGGVGYGIGRKMDKKEESQESNFIFN